VLASASASHCAGMPSANSSEAVDAHAGVVPTNEAMMAILDEATTMRRMRAPRVPAFIATPALTVKMPARRDLVDRGQSEKHVYSALEIVRQVAREYKLSSRVV